MPSKHKTYECMNAIKTEVAKVGIAQPYVVCTKRGLFQCDYVVFSGVINQSWYRAIV